MFAIHIASCLIDEMRAHYLLELLETIQANFPNIRTYIGFDIIGMDHKNADILRPIIANNNMFHTFDHSKGLGYSWNHLIKDNK